MRYRSFLALGLAFALAACAAPDGGEASAPAGGDALAVTVSDFMIDPSDLEVAGTTVTIDVVNDGPTPHNLSVRDADGEVVMATADLSTGDSETITAELEPGDYTIFCSLAGHESLGMSGTLTVAGG
jgi:plastocyanin